MDGSIGASSGVEKEENINQDPATVSPTFPVLDNQETSHNGAAEGGATDTGAVESGATDTSTVEGGATEDASSTDYDEDLVVDVLIDVESIALADAIKHGPQPSNNATDAWKWSWRYQDYLQYGDDGIILRYSALQQPGMVLNLPDPAQDSDVEGVFEGPNHWSLPLAGKRLAKGRRKQKKNRKARLAESAKRSAKSGTRASSEKTGAEEEGSADEGSGGEEETSEAAMGRKRPPDRSPRPRSHPSPFFGVPLVIPPQRRGERPRRIEVVRSSPIPPDTPPPSSAEPSLSPEGERFKTDEEKEESGETANRSLEAPTPSPSRPPKGYPLPRGRPYSLPLGEDFRIIAHPKRFFWPGRIFEAIWFEPGTAGPSYTLSALEWTNACPDFREAKAYAAIRHFVVVRKRLTHALCFRITTPVFLPPASSSPRKNQPPGRPTPQCVLHPYTMDPPMSSEREYITRAPVAVVMENDHRFMSPLARLDVSRLYTFDYSQRVMRIGRVHPDWLSRLEEHFQECVAPE